MYAWYDPNTSMQRANTSEGGVIMPDLELGKPGNWLTIELTDGEKTKEVSGIYLGDIQGQIDCFGITTSTETRQINKREVTRVISTTPLKQK
jgi:hypothetical protein